jgi:hypothetical protein
MLSNAEIFRYAIFITLTLLFCSQSFAINEELYEPEPPSNSSYIRIIHAGSVDSYDVSVDGIKRIRNLKSENASQYLILASGSHQIKMMNISHPEKIIITSVAVIPGHSFTYAFLDYADIKKPVIFEDIAISNRLKTQLTVYNLSSNMNKIDLETADGKLTIFNAIDKYTSKYLAVNPIEAIVQLVKSENKKVISKQSLKLVAGTNFSVFLLSTRLGQPVTSQLLSSVEKYQPK